MARKVSLQYAGGAANGKLQGECLVPNGLIDGALSGLQKKVKMG